MNDKVDVLSSFKIMFADNILIIKLVLIALPSALFV